MTHFLFALLLSLSLVSCGNSSETSDAQIGEILSNIEIQASSRGISWPESYSKAIFEILDHEEVNGILSAKINSNDLEKVGCQNLNELDVVQKKIFYIVYFAAIAEAESDFRTGIKTINPGDYTTNVGLLQIDISAARNHTRKALGPLEQRDLVEPHTNLEVGAFVLKNQILGKTAKGRLFPAKSYYWSVLTYPKRLLKNVEHNRENIPFCQK